MIVTCPHGCPKCFKTDEQGAMIERCRLWIDFPSEQGPRWDCSHNWAALLAFDTARQVWRTEAAISEVRKDIFQGMKAALSLSDSSVRLIAPEEEKI